MKCTYKVLFYLFAALSEFRHVKVAAANYLIDLGANCGNSYMEFLEGSPETHYVFANERNLRAYLFEPNPVLINGFLRDLARNDSRVTVVPRAVSDTSNNEVSFYLTKGQDDTVPIDQLPKCLKNRQPMGASSLSEAVPRAGKEIKVKTLDFVEWFNSLFVVPSDTVAIKIDIESSEYDLMPYLISNPAFDLCLVDFWFIEWHPFFGQHTKEESIYIKNQFRGALEGCHSKIALWHR